MTSIPLAVARPAGVPRSGRRWPEPLVAAAVAAGSCGLLVLLGVHGGDEPAQRYRSMLAGQGSVLWDNYWYAGIHLPSYSLLYPWAAGLVGNVPLVCAGAIAASALFASLAGGLADTPAAGRWAARTLAVLSSGPLVTGEYPYSLGVSALVATGWMLWRRRPVLAAATALLTVAFSPLAFAFLSLLTAGLAVTGRQPWLRRNGPFIVGMALAAGIAVASQALFPVRGWMWFPASTLLPALGVLLLCAVGCRRRSVPPVLPVVVVLWAGFCLLAFNRVNPVGYIATRPRMLFFPVVLLAVQWPVRPRQVLTVLALGLSLIWTVRPYALALPPALTTATAERGYWSPALSFLRSSWTPDYRVEVVPTPGHWEAWYVAERFPLARGWYRQPDLDRNPDLYRDLTAARYARWLRDNGVRYVLLPPGVVEGRWEQALLRSGRSDLRELPPAGGWRFFELVDPTPLLTGVGPAQVLFQQHTVIGGTLSRAGSYLLRLHFDPYWRVRGAVCVRRAPGDLTVVEAAAAGSFTLTSPTGLQELLPRLAAGRPDRGVGDDGACR